MNYKTPPELKLEEENRQDGWEFPPAGLLVFQHGTQFPAVQSFLTMLLMKPAGSWRRQRSGHWSRGRRMLGERNLRGERVLWRPSEGRN